MTNQNAPEAGSESSARLGAVTPMRAMKASKDPWEFAYNNQPKCPHCGADIDIEHHDLSRLYEEGVHQLDCPYCEMGFTISTRVNHNFSTLE